MPFSARNARYLRISAHTVLPLYIYLDDKHLEWMSDHILQHVLADLRPDIGPKLRMESGLHGPSGGSSHAKKGSVAVHRGDTYQFAYFFRKNEPHAVLIKSRTFVPAPPPASLKVPIAQPQQRPPPTRKKRKRGETGDKSATNRTGHRKSSQRNQGNPAGMARELDSEDAGNSQGGIDGPRRSLRKNNLVSGTYKEVDEDESDIEMTDLVSTDRNAQPADDATQVIQDEAALASLTQQAQQPVLEEAAVSSSAMASESEPGFSQSLNIAGEEEEKPKMAMKVSYQGFTIYDRCLCVVIEPWPPLRDPSRMPSRAPSLAPNGMRMSSIPPVEQRGETPVSLRERTPLFLPEIDPRRSLTPAPLPARILPPVPLFDDPSDPHDGGEDTGDGMMDFSQVLNSVGGERAGSVDEDANEGDVFLGDADERRGDL